MRILIVEDDSSVARALLRVLELQGHNCDHTTRGDDALLRHRDADLVLLDLGLAGGPDAATGDGFEVLRRLRQVSDVPVVIVSARGDERSTVRGLHLGADDYLVKPVRVNELLARIGAVTRRRGRAGHPTVVAAGDVRIDLTARTVHAGDREVMLTPKEFELLEALAKRPGEAVRRQLILDEVWGDTFVGASRSCDVHFTSLRAKLDRPGVISTIRGFGYRLET